MVDERISAIRESIASAPRTLGLRPRSFAFAIAICIGLMIATTGVTHITPVRAESQSAATKPADDDIDPDAVARLNAMGNYLRNMTAFQVQAAISTDDVLDDGEVVQANSNIDMLASKPNHLRVDVTGDAPNRLYLYDGKNFTVWGHDTNYYATVPAPPTIKELLEDLQERFDIEMPLIDLFRWGTETSGEKDIKGAIDIGTTEIGGVTCEHYAFHQADIDWQIWIQLGDHPLPRKLVIRTLSDASRPQHSEVLTWNLAPSYNNEAFTFDAPEGAHKIVLAELKNGATKREEK